MHRLRSVIAYHVFEMYKVHQDARFVPTELAGPEYRRGNEAIPALSVSASQDAQGRLHLSLVNLDPNAPARVVSTLVGAKAKKVSGRVLTAGEINAYNTFDRPDAVKATSFGAFTQTA